MWVGVLPRAQEWIRSHSLEAKCFVGCEMGNLLKPVFGGSCTHLHSPALMAVQQSDTDETHLGPVNTWTLDSQHYQLRLFGSQREDGSFRGERWLPATCCHVGGETSMKPILLNTLEPVVLEEALCFSCCCCYNNLDLFMAFMKPEINLLWLFKFGIDRFVFSFKAYAGY